MVAGWSQDAFNGAGPRYLQEAQDTGNDSSALLLESGGDRILALNLQIRRAQPNWQSHDQK